MNRIEDIYRKLQDRIPLTRSDYDVLKPIVHHDNAKILSLNAVRVLMAIHANGFNLQSYEEDFIKVVSPDDYAVVKDNKPVPKTEADRVAEFVSRRNTIIRRPCADPTRRAELEANSERWLKYYLPEAFPLEWSDGHKAIIKAIDETENSGDGTVVAAPRGEGKSTVCKGMGVKLNLTGKCKFLLLGGWKHTDAKEAFKFWVTILTSSERLQEDYPEFTQPFEVSKHSSRLSQLRWNDGTPCGAIIRSTDLIIELPDNRGAIAARSINGDVKGLNVTLSDGSVIRPDKILLDDPQDVKRADNPIFVAQTCNHIETQWICLAGPQKRIAPMFAVTIKHNNDVGDTFSKKLNYTCIKIPRVVQWADGFEEKGSRCRRMWEEWWAQYADEDTRGKAFEFYEKNKDEMVKGMRVSWMERKDDQRGDPDAFFSAMVDYFSLGKSVFYSEYQNAPLEETTQIYTLSPEIIHNMVDESRAPLMIPEWSVLRVAATDLNPSYGFTCELKAYGKDGTSTVLWYAVWKEHPLPVSEEMPETERQKTVYDALVNVGKMFNDMKARPEQWTVDASGEYFDTVMRFCDMSELLCGIRAIPSTGRSGKNFNPNTRSRIGKPRNSVYECKTEKGKWLCWDADLYKERSQRSFLGSLGAPGTCSLFRGIHRDFAEQVCREKLVGKALLGGFMRYEWHTQPGKHDYGDTNAMCEMLAGWNGLGEVAPEKKKSKIGVVVLR